MAKRKRPKNPPDHARVLDIIMRNRCPLVFRLRPDKLAFVLAMILLPAFVLAIGFTAKPQLRVLVLAAFVAEFALLTAYRNHRLVVDADWLRGYNHFGQLLFDCSWGQLQELAFWVDKEGAEQPGLYLASRDQVWNIEGLAKRSELIALIRERAPHAEIGVLDES